MDDRTITPAADAAGSDFLQLDVSEAPAGGISTWLAARLRRAIADGRLPVGGRLPATRVLAAELRVSRGVVTEAYRRLTEDGHVTGHGRTGTIVLAAPLFPGGPDARGPGGPGRVGSDEPAGAPDPVGSAAASSPGGGTVAAGPHGRMTVGAAEVRPGGDPRGGPVMPDGSAQSAPSLPSGAGGPFAGEPGSTVFEAVRAAEARIDLSPGVPELAAFPRAAWLRAERSVLAGLPASGFGYGDPRGTPELRVAVAHWLARYRGIRTDPDEVLIVAGTAQALGLIGRVFHGAGITRVAVEDPGSLGVRQHLRHWGLATPPVPVDPEGVRVDALRATAAPAVLLTPAHQFPTGVVLGGARRRELMRWAGGDDADGPGGGRGGLIIEDDYDAEHRYDRPPVPALRSMLPDRVLYVGSVSKLLAPALRTGWVLAPPGYREALVEAKRFADLGNPMLPQLVLARLMESGDMERQLRLIRRRHRRRRDAMIEAIGTYLPDAVVHGAAAGLHLMITFDAEFSDAELAAAVLARGVKVQPLSWHRLRPGRPGLVLGYAVSSPSAIAEGVAAIGEALRALLRH
ncbi:PLP-dependent aminotransferase family protein [Streptomyces sp. NPDC000410]|uniref:aminotransferase-like domain-containing protein n=1 Tax=Streptomyces sp. NPDC000410 TaxID=3154254 RepID=UPI00332E784A